MNGWTSAKSILVVRLDNAGDVIMLGPALRAIKGFNASAQITLLGTRAGVQAAPLIPWIDSVMECTPIWQALGGSRIDPKHELDLIDELKQDRFDAAIIFTSFSQDPHVPAYVAGLAGIPLRAGQSKEFAGGVLITDLGNLPDETHQVDRNLALVAALGFYTSDSGLNIEISDAARRSVGARLGSLLDEPFVVIHPGASAEARRYPPARFGEVAGLIAQQGGTVLLTGSRREQKLLAEVIDVAIAHAGSDQRIRRAPLDLSMEEYAGVIERSQAVVCNNSLPLHLSDALGKPLVVLYSGTDLESQWRPRRSRSVLLRRPTTCHPCYFIRCPIGKPCLDIDPNQVIEALKWVAPDTRANEPVKHGSKSSVASNLNTCRDTAISRIAVVRALYLGDLLLAVPALRYLRTAYPKAEITLIGLKWAEVFCRRFSMYLDRFLEFPGFPGITEGPTDRGAAEFFDSQRRYGYDVAIQLHGSGKVSNEFTLRLGARSTVGYTPGPSDPRLDVGMPCPNGAHEIERCLDLVAAIDGPGTRICQGSTDLRLEFPLMAEDFKAVDTLLPSQHNRQAIVVIHPGAKSPGRRWPVDRFANLASQLRDRGATVVVAGSDAEIPLAAEIAGDRSGPIVNAAGQTTIGELAALISTGDLFVGNDSGPAHLAQAVGTRSLILFGPEDPGRWGPLDTERHHVLRPSDGSRSVENIGSDSVLWEARKLLGLESPVGIPA